MRYAIIGGGIIGSAIARGLARRKAGSIIVLEKEDGLGRHASGRNSGVIHSGINQKPGSLKARMCLEGSRLLREYCRTRGVPMVECGTVVVARGPEEENTLEKLLHMGRECGVPRLRLIDRQELASREPSVEGVAALLSPTGATVDSVRLLEAVAEDARSLGVEYRLGHEVVKIEEQTLWTSKGPVAADHVINCAGLHADRIAHMMGAGLQYRIIPFRGEYMEVDFCGVRTMVYRAPDLRFPFLSIHLTRETDGRVLAGPSAVLAFGREAYDKELVWREAAGMLFSRQFLRMAASGAFLRLAWDNAKTSLSRTAFLREAQSLVPGIQARHLKPARAGIRAQLVDGDGRMVDDILVQYQEKATHVLNAVSPGMTCGLAFADYLAGSIFGEKAHLTQGWV